MCSPEDLEKIAEVFGYTKASDLIHGGKYYVNYTLKVAEILFNHRSHVDKPIYSKV